MIDTAESACANSCDVIAKIVLATPPTCHDDVWSCSVTAFANIWDSHVPVGGVAPGEVREIPDVAGTKRELMSMKGMLLTYGKNRCGDCRDRQHKRERPDTVLDDKANNQDIRDKCYSRSRGKNAFVFEALGLYARTDFS